MVKKRFELSDGKHRAILTLEGEEKDVEYFRSMLNLIGILSQAMEYLINQRGNIESAVKEMQRKLLGG